MTRAQALTRRVRDAVWNATASIDRKTAEEFAELHRRFHAGGRLPRADEARYNHLLATLPDGARREVERWTR